jgi:glycine betaine/proline transport system substrate-binding protein
VEIIDEPHVKLYQMQSEGKIDLLVTAWLEGSHTEYVDKYREQAYVLQKNKVYSPETFWAVPDYIPESDVAEINDLKKPEVLAKMEKTLHGIGKGAGISRFSLDMLKSEDEKGYGLEALGYNFFNHDNAVESFDYFENSYAEKKWFVFPTWKPQYLHKTYNMRKLKEPKRLLIQEGGAFLVILKRSLPKLSKEALADLENLALGNDKVTEMDYLINKKGYTPKQAAQEVVFNQ